MIKNMTRKGLAIGAGLALVSAGLVATPANANSVLLTLNPTAGTSANVLTTSTFELLTGFDVSVASASLLKFKVTNSAGTSVSVRTSGAAAYANATFRTPGTQTTIGSGGAVDATSFVVVPAATPTLGNTNQIELAVAERDENVSLSVQAFLDTDGNNDISPNEAISTPFTINYIDNENVTATVVLANPAIGSGSLSATVTLSNGINMDQLDADDVVVKFLSSGAAIPSFSASTLDGNGDVDATVAVVSGSNSTTANSTRAVWSATNGELKATFTPTDIVADTVGAPPALNPLVVAAGTVYGAQAQLLETGTTYEDSGSPMFKSSVAGQVQSMTTVAAAKSASVNGSALRAGAGSFTVSTTVTPVGTNPKAGQTVTFTIEESNVNSLHSGATVTAGGKTLSNSNATTSQKIEVDVVTDADGKATLAIAYAGLRDANAIKIKASALGASATVDSTGGFQTFTAQNSATAAVVDVAAVGGTGTGTDVVRNIVQGGAIAIQYRVVDQFGQTPDGDLRLVITEDSTSAVFSTTLPVVNGVATLNVNDNSSTNNNYAITALAQKRNAVSGVWEVLAVSRSAVSNIRVAAAQTVAAASLTASALGTTASPLALTNLDLVNADLRVLQNSVAAPAYQAAVSTLSGTVTGANGAALSGQMVTLSSPNIMFVDNDSKVHSVGTITLMTNSSGAWNGVGVYSNTAGSQVVTVSSGAATATVTLVFAQAANTAGAAWSITAPASVTPGSTFTVSAKLTDKWGNPVSVASNVTPKVTVSYVGPGFPVATLPTSTNAAGELSFGVLLGTNDRGTATVTVTYDADGGATPSTTDAVTTQRTITIGTAAAVTGTARAWTRAMADGTIKMYARDLVGAGKVTFHHNGREVAWIRAVDATDPKLNVLSDGMVRTRALVSGRNVFEIKVNGVQLVRRIATGS